MFKERQSTMENGRSSVNIKNFYESKLEASKKMHQMMKECKGELLYFEKNHLNLELLYYEMEGVLFFDDNDNNNTLLVLKYKVTLF